MEDTYFNLQIEYLYEVESRKQQRWFGRGKRGHGTGYISAITNIFYEYHPEFGDAITYWEDIGLYDTIVFKECNFIPLFDELGKLHKRLIEDFPKKKDKK